MPAFDLMLITDEAPELTARVERALSSAPPGRVAVQLRRKDLGAGDLLELAQELREITARRGCALIVNDRIDVALAAGADGVHLPARRSFPAAAARRLVGPTRFIGMSCHDAVELTIAERDGADYALLAPVFEVPGKGPPLGLDRFADLVRAAALPVYALGGITDAHVPALLQAGAHGVAVIRHALGAADPGQRVESLLSQLCARPPSRDR